MPASGYDLANEWVWGQSINPASRTATVTGSGVDLQDTGHVVTAFLSLGALAGGGPLLDVALQESRNDNTAGVEAADPYAAFSPAATFAQHTGTDDNKVVVLTVFTKTKRYVRAVGTQTGSATALIYGLVLGAPKISY